MNLKNKKLSNDEFFKIREEEVLSSWATGEGVRDLEANIEYAKSVPDHKNFAKQMEKAKNEGITLAQPTAGVALINKHIELLQYLQEEGGADLLPSTIDSYTRQNRYDECEVGIAESRKAGRSLLNGFPGVNHGVEGCRKVLEAVNVPLESRHGTPDGRLLAEITSAAGWTSNEGGGISYNIPYAKSVTVEKTIRDWQYCDRLVGLYEEAGVSINREPFGPLTGTLVPPSTSNAVAIVEALLAAEQGVKSITVGYGQCGNMIQDVAAIRSLQEQCDEYLRSFGYNDCVVTTVFHQWMGGFPGDESQAFAVICWGATAACLAGADKVIVKTPHEAMGIPTKEANVQGLKATRQMINMLRDQRQLHTKAVEREADVIRREVRCILDKVLELGEGDVMEGAVAAFEIGVLDVAFAPSVHCRGKLLSMRDNEGCIRLFNPAAIPFDADLVAYHRDCLAERGRAEGRNVSFQMITDDIYAVSKGQLVGRPR